MLACIDLGVVKARWRNSAVTKPQHLVPETRQTGTFRYNGIVYLLWK